MGFTTHVHRLLESAIEVGDDDTSARSLPCERISSGLVSVTPNHPHHRSSR